MKILILGARGQLGNDCNLVFGSDHEILAADLPETDITNQKQVDLLFDDFRPEVVINCAAFTRVDACESESEICWAVNAGAPGFLARASARHDAFLVHVSTDYVFDGLRPVPEPYTETDEPAPVSEYGRSKLAGEKAVLENAEKYAIVRTAWLYGDCGANFLKTMLRLAVSDSARTIKVVNDQYGAGTWSFRLALQIQKILDKGCTGIFHATAQGHSTWYELARFFLTQMGLDFNLVPCTTEEYPTPAKRPANSILANERLCREGIDIMEDWKVDVEHFVRKYKSKLMAEARK
jgi:dTDP-4-dehydrorhamnose reductase